MRKEVKVYRVHGEVTLEVNVTLEADNAAEALSVAIKEALENPSLTAEDLDVELLDG